MKEKKLSGAALKSHLARLARLAGLPPEPRPEKPVSPAALTVPCKISTFEKHRDRYRTFKFDGYQYHLGGFPETRRAVAAYIRNTYGR